MNVRGESEKKYCLEGKGNENGEHGRKGRQTDGGKGEKRKGKSSGDNGKRRMLEGKWKREAQGRKKERKGEAKKW